MTNAANVIICVLILLLAIAGSYIRKLVNEVEAKDQELSIRNQVIEYQKQIIDELAKK